MKPGVFARRNAGWVGCVLLSVAVTFFSYPPFRLGPLMFVGLVPLFIALETAPTWRSAAFRAWVYVFLGNSAICWWIAYSVHEFAQLPWAVSYPFVFVLSAVEQGAWPVIAGLRHVLHRRFGVRPLLWTPAAIMALDAIWPKFFPNTMGDVFYGMPVLRQAADVTGVWGLTALLAASNELVAALIVSLAVKKPRAAVWPRRELWRHGLVTVALVAGAFAYGGWRLAQVRALMERPARTARIALIQPNIGSFLKVMAEKGHEHGFALITDQLERLSRQTLGRRPSLIIWPETAYPTFYHAQTVLEDPWRTARLDEIVRRLGVPVLTGGYDADGPEGDDRYNAAFLITPQANGLDLQRYHKVLLLKPAEELPWLQSIGWVRAMLRDSGAAAFTAGEGPKLLTSGGLRWGPLICLEGLYPSYARAIVREGAQAFVNLTNDSWFGPGMEPELHLMLTAFRAVEQRRPIVRDTNTGHTAVIDIDGSLRFETELDREQASVVDVPIYSDELHSPFFLLGGALLALAGLACTARWIFAARGANLKT